jgi:hypothetical protein
MVAQNIDGSNNKQLVLFSFQKLKSINTINKPMKQPNNIDVISKRRIC